MYSPVYGPQGWMLVAHPQPDDPQAWHLAELRAQRHADRRQRQAQRRWRLTFRRYDAAVQCGRP